MGKRERKIEVIQKYIQGAAGNWPAYAYGKIPDALIRNACSSYAGAVQKGNILGLIDITVLGSGKKGMMFTENKIYYDNGMLADRGSISYMQIYNEGSIPGKLFGAAYNATALQELIGKLSIIEGETLQDVVTETIDGLEQGMQSIVGVVEQGVKLFDLVSGFLGNNGSNDE